VAIASSISLPSVTESAVVRTIESAETCPVASSIKHMIGWSERRVPVTVTVSGHGRRMIFLNVDVGAEYLDGMFKFVRCAIGWSWLRFGWAEKRKEER
jgi:hypothetical protein